jgi:hypothetical protein
MIRRMKSDVLQYLPKKRREVIRTNIMESQSNIFQVKNLALNVETTPGIG